MFYLITGREHSGRNVIVDILKNVHGWNIIDKDGPLSVEDFQNGINGAVATLDDVHTLQNNAGDKVFHIVHIAPSSESVYEHAAETNQNNKSLDDIMSQWHHDDFLFAKYEKELTAPIEFHENGNVKVLSNEIIKHNFTEKGFIDIAESLEAHRHMVQNLSEIIKTCIDAGVIQSENERVIIGLDNGKNYAILPEIASQLAMSGGSEQMLEIVLAWISLPCVTVSKKCGIADFTIGRDNMKDLLRDPVFASAQAQMGVKLNPDELYDNICNTAGFTSDLIQLMKKHISIHILHMREASALQ